MGWSSKKTTTHSTTNTSQTPTNPEWVTKGLEGLGGKIADLSKLDPYSLIAGPDPLQTQAGQGASQLSTSPLMGQGAGMVAAGATGGPNVADSASLLDGLANYMSPYTDQVVNSTLAGFDQGAGYSRAGDTLARAGDSTFGGSGGAIQTALNEQNILRDRTQTEAQLRDQAFTTGAGLSNLDAGRRQQNSQFNAGQHDAALQRLLSGGTSLAGIGEAQGADQRQNLSLQMNMGQILQQLAQQKVGAPVSLLGTQAGLMGSLPLGLLHGQTGTSTTDGTQTVSDPMGSLGSLLQAGAAVFGAPFTGGTSLGLLGGLGGGAGGGILSGLSGLMKGG